MTGLAGTGDARGRTGTMPVIGPRLAALAGTVALPAGRVSRRRLLAAAGVGLLALVALAGLVNPAQSAAPSAAGQSGQSALLGGGAAGFDVVDLGAKTLLVLGALLVTLKFLGRTQGAAARRSGHLAVLESRSIASKASLHLVAVGDRRLVIGLTPGGMVALAELDAAELEAPEADAPTAVRTAAPTVPATPFAALGALAERLAGVRAGGASR